MYFGKGTYEKLLLACLGIIILLLEMSTAQRRRKQPSSKPVSFKISPASLKESLANCSLNSVDYCASNLFMFGTADQTIPSNEKKLKAHCK